MATNDSPEIDHLPTMWGERDRNALRVLMPPLYDELRRGARQQFRQNPFVELRFCGGPSIGETAEVPGKRPATLKQDRSTARIWLYQQLNGEAQA
jgi:hypothetical protein